MKTKAELNALKQEYENLTVKFQELTEDELKFVTGGWTPGQYAYHDWPEFGSFTLRRVISGNSNARKELETADELKSRQREAERTGWF